MPKTITAEELLEKRISELEGAEKEKKKELTEIRDELKRVQKALGFLTGLENNKRQPKPKRKNANEKERTTEHPVPTL